MTTANIADATFRGPEPASDDRIRSWTQREATSPAPRFSSLLLGRGARHAVTADGQEARAAAGGSPARLK